MRRLLVATLLASLASLAAPAWAGPVEDRSAAFDVLGHEATVERALSNCRWIRRVRDDALLARWRRANREVSGAAKAVIASQGGLTEPRRKVVDDLAGSQHPEWSESAAACKAYLLEVDAGRQDLTGLVQPDVLRRVFSAPHGDADGPLWVLEQRRAANGTLGWSARPYAGEGGMIACEAEGAAKGHVSFRRQRFDENMMPLPDPEASLWLAECMAWPANPVTGAAPPPDGARPAGGRDEALAEPQAPADSER